LQHGDIAGTLETVQGIPMTSVFLTARWQHIVLANYAVDQKILQEYIPSGTELDSLEGETYVSLVGFLFAGTRIMGVSIPFHGLFEEVNLRFYVRRKVEGEWRRGVVFIKELVPKWAVTKVARWVYHENYATLRMGHRIEFDHTQAAQEITYTWESRASACKMNADLRGARDASSDEHARFFADHYWGYSRRNDSKTIEYQVEHPPWELREPVRFQLAGDLLGTYSRVFSEALSGGPQSVIVAEGSEICVHRGSVL